MRVFYADEKGRPVAVVHGPAVYRAGHCGRGLQPGLRGLLPSRGFDAWVGALGEPDSSGADDVTLSDSAAGAP